jgi:hypothetical protein
VYRNDHGDVEATSVSDQYMSKVYCSGIILSRGVEAIVKTDLAGSSESVID